MKPSDICLKAAELVSRDRAASHGNYQDNYEAIAGLWNAYFKARTRCKGSSPLSAEDVANMMELLKIARRLNGEHNIDDYIDGAGYAALAGALSDAPST